MTATVLIFLEISSRSLLCGFIRLDVHFLGVANANTNTKLNVFTYVQTYIYEFLYMHICLNNRYASYTCCLKNRFRNDIFKVLFYVFLFLRSLWLCAYEYTHTTCT